MDYHQNSDNTRQPPYDAQWGESDLALIMNGFRDHIGLILGLTLVAMVFSFLYVSRIAPQFVATAEVMATSARINTDEGAGPPDSVELRSHVEILQSPTMIRAVITEREMGDDPEIGGRASYINFESAPSAVQTRMIDAMAKRLTVRQVIGTALIEVSYRSSDPVKAAQISNALITVYQNREIADKQSKVQVSLAALQDQIDDVRADITQTESRLDMARAKTTVSDPDMQDTRLTQIELLSRQLAKTQAQYIELQSLIGKADSLAADADVTDGQTVNDAQDALAQLQMERARLGQRYGPNHPVMKANAREIEQVENRIDNASTQMTDTVRAQLAAVRDTIDRLGIQISEYRQSYQADTRDRRLIDDLKTQLDSLRATYADLLKSYQMARQDMVTARSNLTLVSLAVPPVVPAYPNIIVIVLLCTVTGLFMGLFLALILEKIQNTVQSPGQLEKMTGVPVYGVVPRAKKFKGEAPATYIGTHKATGLAEWMRSLYMAFLLRHSKKQSGGRVITMTSTLPDEGKSTLSVWLATIAARHGDRVIIIDADMRRPSLHQKYDIGNARGLADYLSDRLPLADVIYKNHASGVHLMTSKAIPTHALTLVSSERMQALVRQLRDLYDLIIFDAPTSLIFSDARILSTLSDKTFYVVEWKKTRRDVLMSSVKQFVDMGQADNMAFIMNKADIQKYMPGYAADMAYLYQSNHKK